MTQQGVTLLSSQNLSPWAMPPEALTEWLTLSQVLDEVGVVPCRSGDAEAWWPDRKQLDSPATQSAIAACCRCPAEAAFLSYGLAADQRFGVWGGTVPEGRDGRRGRRVTSSPQHGSSLWR